MALIAVPDDVLQAVAETPDLWPAIIEMSRWYRDVRTGSIEIEFGDGAPRMLSRQEQVSLRVKLPPRSVPICPSCQGKLENRDFGNKVYCHGCDSLWPVWEIIRRKSYQEAEHGS